MTTSSILKENGLRITQQRILIYDILNECRIHPTVDMLYKKVAEKDDTIGIATVYKTIDAFKSHNIVQELKSEKTPSRYDINTSDHAHFECSCCGKFEDLMPINVDDIIAKSDSMVDYKIKSANVIFSGYCSDCM